MSTIFSLFFTKNLLESRQYKMLYDTRWRPPYGKSEQSLRGGIPPPNALYIIIIYAGRITGSDGNRRKPQKKALPTFRLAEPSAGGELSPLCELRKSDKGAVSLDCFSVSFTDSIELLCFLSESEK